jgi:hypothetical protein
LPDFLRKKIVQLEYKGWFTVELKFDPKATAEPTTPPKLKIAQK